MEYEEFIQNKDICELQGCCAATATKIIKKIKSTYEIEEDELPRKNVIPKSCYDDFFKKKKPKRKDTTADQSK